MLRDSLMDWMPDYYTGEHVRDIQEVRDSALAGYEEKQQRVYDDMFISTAKDIGLWEKEYEMTPTATTLEERRKNLLAYIRIYGGNITAESLWDLVMDYVGGGYVTVTEYPDDFLLKIVCIYRATADLDVGDLRATILDTVQAHVAIRLDISKIAEAKTSLHFGLKLRGSFTVASLIST